MPAFHSLKVAEVRRETPDCVSVAFEIPEDASIFRNFLAGQYLTLRTAIDGEDIRRPYSICSSPIEGTLRVAIKKIPGGKFSTYANERLKAGDTLEVLPPSGNFHVPIDPNHKKRYIAFAAGSGITPVLSILREILVREPNSSFTLFYGNRTTESIIFREALEGLKNKYLQRFSLFHILSREDQGSDLLSGRIDLAKLPLIFPGLIDPLLQDEYFLCGPLEMVQVLRQYLESAGVDDRCIHHELFNAGPQPFREESTTENSKETEVNIRLDGNSFRFTMKDSRQALLDAALLAGADLPFSCKGGVCCTCKAKLLNGEVEMHLNYALEPAEVEAGYILTCQAYPLSEKINVDFDQ